MSTAMATISEVPGTARTRRDPYDDIEPVLAELAAFDTDDPGRLVLRDRIIERCLPLAEHIARRFAGRGEAFDDLLQIARVGLVLAVDRFDTTRGTTFLSYAVPTIMGEVRRHFRDTSWSVRVPRRLKELHLRITAVTPALAQRLNRMPNAGDLAAELGTDREEIAQALVAANGYSHDSLDAELETESTAKVSRLHTLGVEEPAYELVEETLTVEPLLDTLSDRERTVLELSFFQSRTQSQIGAELGVSQMQVSRILNRTLRTLRERALAA